MKNLRNIAVIAFVGVLLTCCDYFTGKDIYNATNEPVWMSMTFNGQKHYPDTTFTAEMLERVSVVGSQDYYYRISFWGKQPWAHYFGVGVDTISLFIGKGRLPGDRESPDEGPLRVLARYDLSPMDMEHCRNISYPPNAEMKALGIKVYLAPEDGNPDYPGISALVADTVR